MESPRSWNSNDMNSHEFLQDGRLPIRKGKTLIIIKKNSIVEDVCTYFHYHKKHLEINVRNCFNELQLILCSKRIDLALRNKGYPTTHARTFIYPEITASVRKLQLVQ
uniref:Uncharacterized protein n=1 Tax=Vespula pensylvanica TaxID=30213 RepID=A0A834P2Q7_VESPE|nr:hypothetical protein H0235_008072 [Vespula pensylvanica]